MHFAHVKLRLLLPRFAGVVLVLLSFSRVESSPLGSGLAQPQTYSSSDGAYRLRIVPENRSGDGGASYEFANNGEIVWSGRRAYTLRAVTVTTEGNAVGIAYREEREAAGEERKRTGTFFEIVILHRDGTELLRDTMKQRHLRHMSPLPHAVAMHVDEETDSVLIRVAGAEDDCDPLRGSQSWWHVHRLSDGTRVARLDPRTQIDGVDQWWNILQSASVPGTPLIVSQWFTFGGRDYDASKRAGFIALTHHDGTPVWTLEVGTDYASIDLSQTVYRGLMDTYFKDRPALTIPGSLREFRVREDGRERLTAMRVIEDGGGWSVERIGPVDDVSDQVADGEQPLPELRLLERFTLGARRGQVGKYGRIRDFYFDAEGNIYQYFFEADSQGGLRKIDSKSGEVLSEWLLPKTDGRTYVAFDLAGGRYVEQFLVSHQSGETPTEFEAEWRSLATGVAEAADDVFDVYPRSIAIAENGDVALPTRGGVYRYGEGGEVVWSRTQEDRRDYPLMIEPTAATFLKDGSLAILCAQHVLILGGDSGDALRKIDLVKTAFPGDDRRRVGYIREIVGHPRGGFVIKISGDPPSVVWISATGELRSIWSPKYENGRTFSIAGCVRVAPDGTLWTTDGESFLRMTSEGVVDRTLSGRPSTEALGELAGFTVGPDERWYAVEKGSGRVFIYEADGALASVRDPLPDSYVGSVDEAAVVVAEGGDIYVKRPKTVAYMPPDNYLVFAADGSAPQPITFPVRIMDGSFSGSCWEFQPSTGKRCGLNTDGLVIGAAGDSPTVVEKRANGFWLSTVAFDLGPDGSFAMLNNEHDFRRPGYTLDLFDVDGTPTRTLPVPPVDARLRDVLFDGDRAILIGARIVAIMSVHTGETEFWRLPDLAIEGPRWAAYLVAGGTELLLRERGTHEFFRIELP